MTQVLDGERISRQGKIRLGRSVALFDEQGRIFLTRRTDNNEWCLPGGGGRGRRGGMCTRSLRGDGAACSPNAPGGRVQPPGPTGRHKERIIEILASHRESVIK